MTKAAATLSALLILMSTPATWADESETVRWKLVDGWDIRVDPSVNNGCYIAATYQSGNIFRLGFDRQNANGYIMVINQNWASLVAGNKYPIALQFDSESPWEGNATARLMGTLPALTIGFSTPNVMKELASKSNLKIFYKEKEIATLGLKGSATAVDELVKCQDAADRYTRTHPPAAAASSTTNPFGQ